MNNKTDSVVNHIMSSIGFFFALIFAPPFIHTVIMYIPLLSHEPSAVHFFEFLAHGAGVFWATGSITDSTRDLHWFVVLLLLLAGLGLYIYFMFGSYFLIPSVFTSRASLFGGILMYAFSLYDYFRSIL